MRKAHALMLGAIISSGCTDSSLPDWATRVTGTDDKEADKPDASTADGAINNAADAGVNYDYDAFVEPIPPADVEVVITTDNAFSFGYGDAQRVNTFVEGVPSDAEGIFNCPVGFGPESYLVPGNEAPDDGYLYIVAWADRDYTQGALAQFKRADGIPIYSGHGSWEVCATGRDYIPASGTSPDKDTVNMYLTACNSGSQDTFSRGWVNDRGPLTAGARGKLALGEENDSAEGDFPLVCQIDEAGTAGIDAAARWMWFDPEDGASPFVGNLNNRTQSFLIFRLPANVIQIF